MPEFDLIIKNGTIVDGSRMPRYRGDVGIRDGIVTALGRLHDSDASRVLDASGLIVAPGFVDLHTHYDAQVFWDPFCSMSGWHGVTSVVIGNCGFGFAPVAPELRERAMLTLTRNEAISIDAMRAGLPWDWVTFPEFLESLDRTPKAVNLLPYVPLTPLLIWVMGLERAKAGERPTDAEHAEMCRLLNEAMDAGACGWSAQRLVPKGGKNVQRDFDGTPMPTDVMNEETCYVLAQVLADRNDGFMQMTLASDDPLADLAFYERLAEISGRPALFNALVANPNQPDAHQHAIAWLDSCRQRGLKVYAQAMTMSAGITFDFANINLFDDSEPWREATVGTRAERREKLADPARRAALRAELPQAAIAPFDTTLVIEVHRPENKDFENLTVREIADLQGKHFVDAMLDLAVAEDLHTTFFINANTSSPDALVRDVVEYPWAIPGISDGGAHTKFGPSGTYTTEFLIRFVREREWLDLEEAHWRLSTLPARAAGFRDRGMIVEGAPADIVVYDFEQLDLEPMLVSHDLPGGDWRRTQRPTGYRYILVNGEVTIEDGVFQETRPGAVLRHGTGALIPRPA